MKRKTLKLKRASLRLPCKTFATALVCLLAGAAAQAQLEIISSPNAVGSGARALGMGGAFIAVADDATAASWNPGGLTQLERPELSLVYSWKWNSEDFSSRYHSELETNEDLSFSDLNYASFVYPIPRTIGGRNMVLSLNYLRQFDFDRNLDVSFRRYSALPFGNIVGNIQHVNYSQRGQLATLSPAIGFEITDKLSIGAVVNIWDQDILSNNKWKTRNDIRANANVNGVPLMPTQLRVEEDYDDFEGTNYTFGLLWKPTNRISLGAVYHTKFTADVNYTSRVTTRVGGFPGFTTAKRSLEYTFPSAIGLGFAYRFPNDKLTLTLDVTRREWDQFIIYDPENPSLGMRRRSGITGLPKSKSEHDPTYSVRTGAEYVFVNDKKPIQNFLPSIRGGVFYDPEPSGGRSNTPFGLGKVTGEVEDYYGVALGGGVLIKNRINIDAAYVFRFGNDVRQDSFGLNYTDADVRQHTFYLSTVVYF